MVAISKEYRIVGLGHDVVLQLSTRLFDIVAHSGYNRYIKQESIVRTHIADIPTVQFNVSRDDFPDFMYGISD